MMMRHLDLFSGIGGFALAASWVWGEDHKIVSFCEIEDYPQLVLKKHWPDVPCHGDIKTLKGDSFGAIDLITGGFPCQPFSTAGPQLGKEDSRYLFPELLRVISEAGPTWVIGENVSGVVSILREIKDGLEAIGYQSVLFDISASSLGAPHSRRRTWIVAYPISIKPQRFSERLPVNTREIIKPSSFISDGSATERFYRCGNSGTVRRGAGIPNRLDRIKGLGNAIVPQCVVPIMQAIKEATK